MSPFDARDELLRSLSQIEKHGRHSDCCWTWRDEPACDRLPTFRLATPHGQIDFCPEHIGYAIAGLPPEWLEAWAYREPLVFEAGDDDVPF